ncbi:hypothetical protein KKG48_00740, partial [Patescibacteria group bacterium]|nr:hypothetical protein [Patescibacteria group bacterium]
MKFKIPKEVSQITETLQNAGFEAYLVGGCVRDLILKREPKDWDVTTNAKPEEIQNLFEHTYYENTFGTVGVVSDDVENPALKNIEVTPYRLEAKYSDNRRPDAVFFSDKLKDDLKRRDFTMNAIAFDPSKNNVVDLYGGQEDIKNKIIRTVGNPEERFMEDGLRVLRAVRFKAELDFSIEEKTKQAILNTGHILKDISNERIKDEFVKIIMSRYPMKAIEMTHELNILQYIIP